MIVLGIAGKPNVGKSTFFRASTLAPADIAPYPFTTISPNIGVAHVRVRCPCNEDIVRRGAGITDHCGSCVDGNRFIPVQMIDVAGLVRGAHEGRGLGNAFLDDLRRAEAIIHVVDASGGTDAEGNPVGVGAHDPVDDIVSFEREFKLWIQSILKRNWRKIARKASLEDISVEYLLAEQLAGVGVSESDVKVAVSRAGISDEPTKWSDDDIARLAHHILRSKRMVIAANKADIAPEENIERIRAFVVSSDVCADAVISCSAEAELALRRASERGIVKYLPGDEDFDIVGDLTDEQREALMKIREFMHKNGGTGVQDVINYAVLDLLGCIVAYPVEDEHKFSDSSGRILPDALLMKRGSTARDLAFAVHSDMGRGFLFAIDARTRRRLGERYALKDGDIIKIVHSSR